MGGGGRSTVSADHAGRGGAERAGGGAISVGNRNACGIRALSGGLPDAAAPGASRLFLRDAWHSVADEQSHERNGARVILKDSCLLHWRAFVSSIFHTPL